MFSSAGFIWLVYQVSIDTKGVLLGFQIWAQGAAMLVCSLQVKRQKGWCVTYLILFCHTYQPYLWRLWYRWRSLVQVKVTGSALSSIAQLRNLCNCGKMSLFLFLHCLSVSFLSLWLGVKHQFTYLLTPVSLAPFLWVSFSFCLLFFVRVFPFSFLFHLHIQLCVYHSQLLVQTLFQCSYSPCVQWHALESVFCGHITNLKQWQQYHWCTKIQHALGQPSKIPCSCPGGGGIQTDHIRSSSHEEQVHYLCRKRSAEEERFYLHGNNSILY